jgi:DmsE family decaheme c-type cytochrome
MTPVAVPMFRQLITLINFRQCRIFQRAFALVLLLGAIGIALLPQSIAAQGNASSGAVEAQFTAEGTERCLGCHAGERMTIIGATAHGNPDNPDTPYASHGCESCHGPGSLHVSRARGGRGFPALIVFGQSDSAQRQTDACLGCHANDMGDIEGMEWTDSTHDVAGMTCVNCHEAHIVGNPLQAQEPQREACETCHRKAMASHPRFEDKGIVFDKLSCYDCHDVHQLIHEP